MNKLLFSLGILVPFSSSLAKLSEVKTETLLNHVQVIRELKTKFEQKIENEYTLKHTPQQYFSATDVHQSFPQLHEIAVAEWSDFLTKHKDLVDAVINNEREHTKDYYVFYHAQQKEFRLIHDFLKEIFEYLKISQHLKAYEFLRFPVQHPSTIEANSFIEKLDNDYGKGCWNERINDLAKQFLSVNFSLFGNCTLIWGWECTFDYFVNNKSVSCNVATILEEIFDFYHFDKAFINKLLTLNTLITTQEGLLFQICIPKNFANQYIYLCHPNGIPYKKQITAGGWDNDKQRYADIASVLDKYQSNNKSRFKHLKAKIFKDLFDQELDTLQGRILFSQDMMLNPDSGIKIFRYSTAPEEFVAEFNRQLKTITHQILAQWIQEEGTKLLNNSELAKLYTLINVRS